MTDIQIEIDGRTLSVKPGETIIEAADAAGIYIPRFCYHKHLSIAANCRMCLVEVEKSPKTLPACATPVTAGMKVSTRSKKTIEAQRAVMEFLLINHPLDCPICDQGGECELQDLSMGYGAASSEFDECKRSMPELELGPLIATEMTRCIHCTRCVRFGTEIAGLREMGLTERGEHTEVGTYIQHALQSEISGNIIDICPVGALTSKPYRFTARAWELTQAPSISPHDGYGTHIYAHTLSEKVMRVVPKEHAALNQTWIADRDRFSYTALSHEDRLKMPLIKINNEWREASWEEALNVTVERLQTITKQSGNNQLATLLNPSATLEECYLLQKITRYLGSPHIDHRLREVDNQDQAAFGAFPGFELSLAELEECDLVFIIGANVTEELPLLNVRFRKMAANGTIFAVLNPYDYDMHFPVASKTILSPVKWIGELETMSRLLEGDSKHALDQLATETAALLKDEKKIAFISGAQVAGHPHAARLRVAINKLASLCQAKLGVITAGANAAGAWLAGAIPHRGPAMQKVSVGHSAAQLLQEEVKAYLLLNIEPHFDVARPVSMLQALKKAEFVVSLSTYRDPALLEVADVMLPVGPYTETAGTYVNLWGEWQSFHGVTQPLGQSRPAWKVLRVLGELLGDANCNYTTSEAVRDELRALSRNLPSATNRADTLLEIPAALREQGMFFGLQELLSYRSDTMVRRSLPLQEALNVICGDVHQIIKMNPETALDANLKEHADIEIKQGNCSIKGRLQFDEKLAQDVIWLAAATDMSAGLDNQMGMVEVNYV